VSSNLTGDKLIVYFLRAIIFCAPFQGLKFGIRNKKWESKAGGDPGMGVVEQYRSLIYKNKTMKRNRISFWHVPKLTTARKKALSMKNSIYLAEIGRKVK
jgi:hypothetical protein